MIEYVMKNIPDSVLQRVAEVASSFSGDECWIWPRSRNVKSGYGQLSARIKGVQKVFTAHRASWALAFGDSPGNYCVLHKCDNPGCFNPAHLFLGTNKDNTNDMMGKGRGGQRKNPARGARHRSITSPHTLIRGIKNNKAKLTEDQVREILAATSGFVAMARKFGVNYQAVWAVRKRRTWKHINPIS